MELKDFQKEGLSRAFSRIKKYNPEYARAFRLLDSIETYEALSELPFLTKDMLRLGYPFGYISADKNNIARVHMSSGTRGTPMAKSDAENWDAIMRRCLETAGLTAEDVIQLTPSLVLFNGGCGFHSERRNWGLLSFLQAREEVDCSLDL